MQNRSFVVGLIGSCWLLPVSYGQPVVDKQDRVEISWSEMRVRFFGEAQVTATMPLKDIEQEAWQDGMKYADKTVEQIVNRYNSDNAILPTDKDTVGQAVERIKTTSYSYNTIYYADGVRVYLENSLAKLLRPSGLTFKTEKIPDLNNVPHSGVVFKLTQNVKPAAFYVIKNEQGEILFSPHDVAKEAFYNNLMGRWFKSPSQKELAAAVGEKYVEIVLSPIKTGEFMIKQSDWQEFIKSNQPLLIAGKIIFSVQ